MMDFSGSNRGFFFVRYTCREDAKRACKELDNFEIRPHKRLGVLMSMDNNKLWLSGIPNGATADDIRVSKIILFFPVYLNQGFTATNPRGDQSIECPTSRN